MGKAQSKRSVDITTEGKKDEEVVAGKVEKIEDADEQKPQVNGDATPQESDGKEKKENEDSENDKDATTEKSSGEAGGGGGGDQAQQQQHNGEQSAEETAAATTASKDETKNEEEAAKEGGGGGGGAAEEIAPLADDGSAKKTKKEKTKRKWSLRSISFGKKDKQKPAKNDEALSPTTNGETNDKPSEETNNDEGKKVEENGAGAGGDGAEDSKKAATENGEASEKELLNGGGETTTTTPTTEEKGANNESNDTAAGAATTTNNTTASSSTTTSPSTAPVAAVTAEAAASENQTENKVAAAATVTAPVLSNGTIDDIKKEIDVPQQNGTNGQEHNGDGHIDDEETNAADIKAAAGIKSIESEMKSDEGTVKDLNKDTGAGDTFTTSNCAEISAEYDVKGDGAGGDVGSLLVKSEPPPPLPVSPPPSQVAAFALNETETEAEAESAQVEEKEEEEKPRNEEMKEMPEQMEMDEILPLPDPPTSMECELANAEALEIEEARTVASQMVDEITTKAVDIVTDMSQAIEEQFHTEVQDDDDDELPPPPPTPPTEDIENNAEPVTTTIVEEVLNQFESNLNEIEQKVFNMNLEEENNTNTAKSEDETEIEVTTEIKEEEEEKKVELEDGEILDESNENDNDIRPELVVETVLIEETSETIENGIKDVKKEEEDEDELEDGEIIESTEIINTNGKSIHPEVEANGNDDEIQEENVENQVIAISKEELIKLALAVSIEDSDDELCFEEAKENNEVMAEECDSKIAIAVNDEIQAKADTDSDTDLKNSIKEINPIELKEAAAAEITTQDLAVSCE